MCVPDTRVITYGFCKLIAYGELAGSPCAAPRSPVFLEGKFSVVTERVVYHVEIELADIGR
jgi:hypothetical protein